MSGIEFTQLWPEIGAKLASVEIVAQAVATKAMGNLQTPFQVYCDLDGNIDAFVDENFEALEEACREMDTRTIIIRTGGASDWRGAVDWYPTVDQSLNEKKEGLKSAIRKIKEKCATEAWKQGLKNDSGGIETEGQKIYFALSPKIPGNRITLTEHPNIPGGLLWDTLKFGGGLQESYNLALDYQHDGKDEFAYEPNQMVQEPEIALQSGRFAAKLCQRVRDLGIIEPGWSLQHELINGIKGVFYVQGRLLRRQDLIEGFSVPNINEETGLGMFTAFSPLRNFGRFDGTVRLTMRDVHRCHANGFFDNEYDPNILLSNPKHSVDPVLKGVRLEGLGGYINSEEHFAMGHSHTRGVQNARFASLRNGARMNHDHDMEVTYDPKYHQYDLNRV